MLVLFEVENITDAAELMADARCKFLANAGTRGEMVARIEDLEVAELARRRKRAAGRFGTYDLEAVPFRGVLSDERAMRRLQDDLAAQTHGAAPVPELPPEGDPDDDEPLNPVIVPGRDADDGDDDTDLYVPTPDDWTDAPGGQSLGAK